MSDYQQGWNDAIAKVVEYLEHHQVKRTRIVDLYLPEVASYHYDIMFGISPENEALAAAIKTDVEAPQGR